MEIIAHPKTEDEILAVVAEEADGKMIREEMVSKAEYCVDHLCGCSDK